MHYHLQQEPRGFEPHEEVKQQHCHGHLPTHSQSCENYVEQGEQQSLVGEGEPENVGPVKHTVADFGSVELLLGEYYP